MHSPALPIIPLLWAVCNFAPQTSKERESTSPPSNPLLPRHTYTSSMVPPLRVVLASFSSIRSSSPSPALSSSTTAFLLCPERSIHSTVELDLFLVLDSEACVLRLTRHSLFSYHLILYPFLFLRGFTLRLDHNVFYFFVWHQHHSLAGQTRWYDTIPQQPPNNPPRPVVSR